jgi:hypothetical protein
VPGNKRKRGHFCPSLSRQQPSLPFPSPEKPGKKQAHPKGCLHFAG